MLGSNEAFTYDYVFDRDAQQEDVYSTCVEAPLKDTMQLF
jgi:hypothetical protein